MKNPPLLFIFFATLLCLISPKLYANHAMGADLSYRCLDNNQYELTLYFYFDCGSIVQDTPPVNPQISVSSVSCGQLFNINLAQDVAVSGNEVSVLCNTVSSNCNNGAYPGVQQYIYRDTVTLPMPCTDWTFGYQLPDGQTRSAAITNLQSADIFQLYIEATLDNTRGCNDSPVFTQSPIAYYCNQANTFTQAIYEPDGDSLVYSLVHPLDAPFAPIPYAVGFTASNPFNNTAFNFNTQTGDIAFTPNGAQRPVVAVKIEEYRDGELIGSVWRDMQWVILPCNNQQINVSTTANWQTHVCAGTPISLQWQANDPEDGNLTLSSNIGSFPASATFTVSTAPPNSGFDKNGIFNWTPTAADAGFYLFELSVSDNACPIPSQTSYIYQIYVDATPNAGPDLVYCNANGIPIVVTVTGGTDFTWSPGATPLTANGSEVSLAPQLAPGSTVVYSVTNNCGFTDEIVVTTDSPFLASILPNNPAICATEQGIVLQTQTPAGNYTYAWSPQITLNDPTAQAVYATPNQSTTYTVTITNTQSGCVATASTTVTFSSLTGNAIATAAQDTVCAGTAVQLSSTAESIANLSCGITNQPCSSNNVLYSFGAPDDSTYTVTPFNAFWENGRMQILYTADELTAAGIQAGIINEVGFFVTRKFSSTPFNQYHLKMACTNATFANGYQVGLQEVASFNNLNTTEGWNMLPLDQPFYWDGTSNLRIEVCHHINNFDASDEVAFSPTSLTTVTFAQTSVGATGCTLSSITNANLRPNIRFAMCAPQIITNAQINWQPTSGLSASNIANPIATPTQTTTYTVTYNENSCAATASVTVVVPSSDTNIDAQPNTSNVCLQNGTAQVPLSVTGNLPNTTTYSWQPANGLSASNIANPVATISTASSYIVTANLNDFCNTILTDTVQIAVSEPPSLNITPTNAQIFAGDNVQITASGNFDSLAWTPTTNLDNPTAATINAQPTQTTTYTATAQNADGCQTTAQSIITVFDAPADTCLLMPNAFSPNNDGTNDWFGASVGSFDELVLFKIYNRWGQELFSTTNKNDALWDGTYKGKAQPMGVYAYYIQVICNNKQQTQKGNITLVR